MDWVAALLTLTLMEIILGIDNIVFIAIVTSRLPREQQRFGRTVGLILALISRLILLLAIKWIIGMKEPVFYLTQVGIPEAWLNSSGGHGVDPTAAFDEINGVSVRDLILLAGGLFLIGKSVHEIHAKIDHREESHEVTGKASMRNVLFQIAILDIIFSLDSVITAVGMAEQLWVMIVAVVAAMVVMIIFANPIGDFVVRHPTLKMLALSFLILIGVLLVAEGIGTHFPRGYIYFSMVFALAVELLNMRIRPAQPS